RNDYYFDSLNKMLRASGMEYTLERVTDEDEIEALGLDIACMYNYCPGCKTTHEKLQNSGEEYHCVPAIHINGKLVFCGWMPEEDELDWILKEYR
ncbi:MAG: hypothetical protein IKU12_06895, partial [Oscillospiraceae bacterium]|nr:hypothetical protein [Oscillospiraceae bacterium]